MEQKVREVILSILDKPDTKEFTNEMDLNLDSIDFVRIVIGVEDAFDIEFDEFDLNIESFKTINDYVKYVDNQLEKV